MVLTSFNVKEMQWGIIHVMFALGSIFLTISSMGLTYTLIRKGRED